MYKPSKLQLVHLIFLCTLNVVMAFYTISMVTAELIVIQVIALLTLICFIITLIVERSKCTNNNPLLLSTAQYNLLDSLSDCIVIVSTDNTIKFFNQEAQNVTGFKQSEALHINYGSILRFAQADGNLLSAEQDPINLARQLNQPYQAEITHLKTFSDKLIPISLLVNSVHDQSGDLIIAFRDITQKLDKEREQLEFISTASHEMRTPVAAINGYLGLVLNPKIAQIDDKAREYTLKAQASVEHLGELFKNLLNISKAEDRQLPTNPEVLELTDYVGQICTDFTNTAINRDLHLTFLPSTNKTKSLSPNILVYTDKNLLREVVSNLIENALKYTKQGEVTVDVTVKNQTLAVISVTDTGIGISPEDVPHLFQKFYRVDNRQTREVGGTGLGLYLCRKIIESLHGRIWVESVLNRGSTFFIELNRIDQLTANRLLSQADYQAVNPIDPTSNQATYPAPKPEANPVADNQLNE
jgi:signal transduction histidine kinase